MSKPSPSRLTTSRKSDDCPPSPQLNLRFDSCACTSGHYPWDEWERWAVASGLEAELAGLGRLLIREAYQHGWEGWLRNLCGWGDHGQSLLAFARRAPEQARWCWSRLLDTDGLRGDVHPRTGHWTWGYLRIDTRRVLCALHNGACARPLSQNPEPPTQN